MKRKEIYPGVCGYDSSAVSVSVSSMAFVCVCVCMDVWLYVVSTVIPWVGSDVCLSVE